jgi:hypothetical protein
VESRSQKKVTLTWALVSDDRGIWGYRLFRDGRYLKARPAKTQAVTLYLPCGQHTYRVEVVDTANQGASQRIVVRRRC